MGVASTVTQEHVDTVKQYVALRLEKRTKETLQLVSDDVQFYSQRDGSYRGEEEFCVYLEKTKVEGTAASDRGRRRRARGGAWRGQDLLRAGLGQVDVRLRRRWPHLQHPHQQGLNDCGVLSTIVRVM